MTFFEDIWNDRKHNFLKLFTLMVWIFTIMSLSEIYMVNGS